ncbi:hypothetical protein UPYG_G00002530 [Umbra pygmaea]|uniref:Uncharacterized protein n=1 Tax=Umbra pygmaea TaxID=75934 RepID=A0ABD0XGM7_UMBPY
MQLPAVVQISICKTRPNKFCSQVNVGCCSLLLQPAWFFKSTVLDACPGPDTQLLLASLLNDCCFHRPAKHK